MKVDFTSTLAKRLLELGIEAEDVKAHLNEDNVLRLTGEVSEWKRAVDIGHIAAKLDGVRNVVCDIEAPDLVKTERRDASEFAKKGVVDRADVVIIGGGVTGCAALRQLSKYKLDVLLLEKESDICEGTTKANNGMVHSGYDSKTGTLKAACNVKGNAMYTEWARELGFKFNRTGSFVCGFDDEDLETIKGFYKNGSNNKVPGIEVIDGDRARELEPGLNEKVTCALWTPSAGYTEPYEVALALAENALDNGCRLMLDTEVLDVVVKDGEVKGVVTDKGVIEAKTVINAAGLYTDEIAEMAGDRFYSIHPRRGTLLIFDKENAGKLHTYSGTTPRNYTKGGGPQETPAGTLLWGPSAKEVADKEDLAVDADDIGFVLKKGMQLTRGISETTLITYFSGNRAASYNEDFIIENSKKVRGFMHVAGIQSPGLASAPAIAELVEKLYLELNPTAEPDESYNPHHSARKPFRECTDEERAKLIEKDPSYGRVVCRCETVTEGEIVEAIHGKIPARTVDAVKRRTRAGMGRCQAGFCGSRVTEILARELCISPAEVTVKGKGSELLVRPTRQDGGEQK